MVAPSAGVLPRMAQELMRHSDIRLTMNVYTHLQLIDTAGAVESLPSIGRAQRQAVVETAIGTYGLARGAAVGRVPP